MARRCAVCEHPEKAAIEAALLLGNRTNTAISQEYGISPHSLGRHKRNHLKAVLPQMGDVVQAPPGVAEVGWEELITEMRLAKAMIWRIVEATWPVGSDKTLPQSTERRDCLSALRQVDGKIELLAKLETARVERARAQREVSETPKPPAIREIIIMHEAGPRVEAYDEADDAFTVTVSRRAWAEFQSWERRCGLAPPGIPVQPRVADYEGGNGHGEHQTIDAAAQARVRGPGPEGSRPDGGGKGRGETAGGHGEEDEQVSASGQRPRYHESFFEERPPEPDQGD